MPRIELDEAMHKTGTALPGLGDRHQHMIPKEGEYH